MGRYENTGGASSERSIYVHEKKTYHMYYSNEEWRIATDIGSLLAWCDDQAMSPADINTNWIVPGPNSEDAWILIKIDITCIGGYYIVL